MPLSAIIFVILLAAAAREYWLFHRLSAESDAALARGDRAKARDILEKLLSRPAFLGGRSRSLVHHRLAWIYLQEGRPQEAVEQALKSLETRLHPSLESINRMRLADCLEAAGSMERAAIERGCAKRLAEAGPENVPQLLAQGKSLRREGRYAESIPVYERAIALAGGMKRGIRAHLMVSLALSCQETGAMNQALSWADQALQLGPDHLHLTSAYSVSALALSSLGRLDEAAKRWNLALSAASRVNNTTQMARFLSTLAAVQRRRGKLAEAIEASERAAALSLQARRIARFVQFECYLTSGRFSDAREMLERGASAPGQTIPGSERRIQASITVSRALLEAEEGHPETALTHLDQARALLENDEKLGIRYHAMRAWIEAKLGLRDESENSAKSAEAYALKRQDDRGALLRYHTLIGRARLELGDVEAARRHFESCMNLGPDPVDLPRTHYFSGECCYASGDTPGARLEWQWAVDTGLDTRYVNLARGRLEETAAG